MPDPKRGVPYTDNVALVDANNGPVFKGMRRLLAVLGTLRSVSIALSVLFLPLAPSAAEAATYYVMSGGGMNTTGPATSCDTGPYLDAYNAASTGDTIQLGPGTCTGWVNITLGSKWVKIQGAGTVPAQGSATSGGTTLIVNPGPANIAVFNITESAAGNIRLRNIKFQTDSTKRVGQFGIISIGNRVPSGKQIVLESLTFDFQDKWDFCCGEIGEAIHDATARVVVANSIFTGQPPPAPYYVTNRKALAVHMNVNAAVTNWMSLSTFGTNDTGGVNNAYFENNLVEFYNDSIDCSDGCRLVIRNSRFRNSIIKGHGADTGYGARHFEYYANYFECVSGGGSISYWIFQRGGTGVITDNTFEKIDGTKCSTVSGQEGAPVTAMIFRLRSHGCWPQEGLTALRRINDTTAELVAASPHGLTTGQHISVFDTNPPAYAVLAAPVTVVDAVTVRYTPNGTISSNATLWGAYNSQAHATYPGSYPQTRQIGWGWSGGRTPLAYENFGVNALPTCCFKMDLEPTYTWNNTGPTLANAINAGDAGTDECQNGLTTAQFYQQNREWYSDSKPSYTKYQYPHPLVQSGASAPSPGVPAPSSGAPPSPSNLQVK